MLTYGVNQGVGEAFLFSAQNYYFFDTLGLSPIQTTQLDGFTSFARVSRACFFSSGGNDLDVRTLHKKNSLRMWTRSFERLFRNLSCSEGLSLLEKFERHAQRILFLTIHAQSISLFGNAETCRGKSRRCTAWRQTRSRRDFAAR